MDRITNDKLSRPACLRAEVGPAATSFQRLAPTAVASDTVCGAVPHRDSGSLATLIRFQPVAAGPTSSARKTQPTSPLVRLLTVGLGALFAMACPAPEPPPGAESPAARTAARAPEYPLPGEMAGLDPASWVKIYDPAAAFNGFTLALYERSLPILLDMNGNVVHAWPDARVKTRIRLLEDGSLLAIGKGRRVVEYDWEGNLTWRYRLTDALPHHDVIRLSNGHTMMIVRPHSSRYDGLLEVDREGRVAWQWRPEEHLRIDPAEVSNPADVTHMNSVQELPQNPWFDGGDRRFRPGNLLVSARNLDRVFVVDRQTGDVVWEFEDRLDMQHEALMVEPGHVGHGNVMILSNGKRNDYGYRQSAVLEVRPADGEILWEYRADGFYTRFGGLEQPLVNGNVLIVSADRTFEIDRSGTIVWQWVPPFRPTRSRRYAADHSPQLTALARRRRPSAVRPLPGYRHVDRPAYQFAYPEDRRQVRLDGVDVEVIDDNNLCRRLLLPAEPGLQVVYGLLPAANGDGGAVRFAAHLRPDGASAVAPLFEDTLAAPAAGRRERSFDLAEHAGEWARLCVETTAEGGAATEPLAYWLNPAITSAGGAGGDAEDDEAPRGLTPEELEVRREHLEALGYVD